LSGVELDVLVNEGIEYIRIYILKSTLADL